MASAPGAAGSLSPLCSRKLVFYQEGEDEAREESGGETQVMEVEHGKRDKPHRRHHEQQQQHRQEQHQQQHHPHHHNRPLHTRRERSSPDDREPSFSHAPQKAALDLVLQGRYAEAHTAFSTILASLEQQLGSGHATTIAAAVDVARVLQHQRSYEEAAAFLTDHLSRADAALAPTKSFSSLAEPALGASPSLVPTILPLSSSPSITTVTPTPSVPLASIAKSPSTTLVPSSSSSATGASHLSSPVAGLLPLLAEQAHVLTNLRRHNEALTCWQRILDIHTLQGNIECMVRTLYTMGAKMSRHSQSSPALRTDALDSRYQTYSSPPSNSSSTTTLHPPPLPPHPLAPASLSLASSSALAPPPCPSSTLSPHTQRSSRPSMQSQGVAYCRRAMEVAEQHLGPAHVETVASQCHLAAALQRLGGDARLDALPLLGRAWATVSAIDGSGGGTSSSLRAGLDGEGDSVGGGRDAVGDDDNAPEVELVQGREHILATSDPVAHAATQPKKTLPHLHGHEARARLRKFQQAILRGLKMERKFHAAHAAAASGISTPATTTLLADRRYLSHGGPSGEAAERTAPTTSSTVNGVTDLDACSPSHGQQQQEREPHGAPSHHLHHQQQRQLTALPAQNTSAHKSQHHKPRGSAPSAPPRVTPDPRYALGEGPLPDAWVMCVTPAGRPYFVNKKERKATWVDPRLGGGTDGLPPGWERAVDGTGDVYYIDHVNRRTQREPPVPALQPNRRQVRSDGGASGREESGRSWEGEEASGSVGARRKGDRKSASQERSGRLRGDEGMVESGGMLNMLGSVENDGGRVEVDDHLQHRNGGGDKRGRNEEHYLSCNHHHHHHQQQLYLPDLPPPPPLQYKSSSVPRPHVAHTAGGNGSSSSFGSLLPHSVRSRNATLPAGPSSAGVPSCTAPVDVPGYTTHSATDSGVTAADAADAAAGGGGSPRNPTSTPCRDSPSCSSLSSWDSLSSTVSSLTRSLSQASLSSFASSAKALLTGTDERPTFSTPPRRESRLLLWSPSSASAGRRSARLSAADEEMEGLDMFEA